MVKTLRRLAPPEGGLLGYLRVPSIRARYLCAFATEFRTCAWKRRNPNSDPLLFITTITTTISTSTSTGTTTASTATAAAAAPAAISLRTFKDRIHVCPVYTEVRRNQANPATKVNRSTWLWCQAVRLAWAGWAQESHPEKMMRDTTHCSQAQEGEIEVLEGCIRMCDNPCW